MRRKIYDYLNKNPGLHVREISRKMQIPKTTLNYHLKCFKKLGLIEEKSGEKCKYIYISKKVGKKEKQILNFLRKETACKIFIYLLFSIAFSKIEISKELEISYQKASYYIKKMEKLGIIEEADIRNDVVYAYPNPNDKDFKDCIVDRKPKKSEKIYIRKNQDIINIAYKILIRHRHSLKTTRYIDYYLVYYGKVEEYISNKKSLNKDLPIFKKIRSLDEALDNAIEVGYFLLRPPFCA